VSDEPEKKNSEDEEPRAEGKRLATVKVPKIEKPKGPDAWDRAATWLVEQGPLPALAIITIAIAIVHARIFLGETAGDDLSFHFAESARLADCIAVGDFDFWNPSANAGYASLYSYQTIPPPRFAIAQAYQAKTRQLTRITPDMIMPVWPWILPPSERA